MSKLILGILVLVISLNAYSQTCPGSPGCLDETFGTGGVASYSIDPYSSNVTEMVTQDDSKIVVTVGGHKIVRMNSDGTLDQSFGSGGVATFDWSLTSGSTTYDGTGFGLALQYVGGEQRIIVGGRGYFLSGRKVAAGLRVGRFLPDGSVDTSFGTNGSAIINTVSADHVKIQGDGKILALGWPLFIARLTPNGSLDTSFASGGLLNAGAGYTTEPFHSTNFMLDPLGRILVIGDVSIGNGVNKRFVMSVKRFSSAGVADTAFGAGGSARADFGRTANAGEVVIDPTGNIIARGLVTSPDGFAIARFTSNGLADMSLAGTGKVTFLDGRVRRGIFFQADGKIVITGRINEDYALVRYNYDGTLDSGFGSGGSTRVNIDGADWVKNAVMQFDPFCSCSKIVMGGDGPSPSNSNFARFIIQ